MKKILIINTGGTLNKAYNQITGQLELSKSNKFIQEILSNSLKQNANNCEVIDILYKDSLDLNDKNRDKILKTIKKSEISNIIIIHGTDTMNKTAKFISKNLKQSKNIVFVGSMVPYSVDKIEAVSNIMLSIGFLQNTQTTSDKHNGNNIFMCMDGLISHHSKIYKNKKLGKFFES